MVVHERLTDPLVTMEWLLPKWNSLSDLPAFLDSNGSSNVLRLLGVVKLSQVISSADNHLRESFNSFLITNQQSIFVTELIFCYFYLKFFHNNKWSIIFPTEGARTGRLIQYDKKTLWYFLNKIGTDFVLRKKMRKTWDCKFSY